MYFSTPWCWTRQCAPKLNMAAGQVLMCSMIRTLQKTRQCAPQLFLFYFFWRINGRILFKERIKLYKNKAASWRAKENCTNYRAFLSPIKKQQLYARLHQGKPKKKNEIIKLVLKNIAIFGSFLLCIIWSATSAWHYDRS